MHRPEPKRGRSMREIVKNASPDVYAFSFYSIFEIVVEIDGRQEVMRSSEFNRSKQYYIDARVFTVDEFAKHYPDKPETVIWAGTNRLSHLIMARSGHEYHYQPDKKASIATD